MPEPSRPRFGSSHRAAEETLASTITAAPGRASASAMSSLRSALPVLFPLRPNVPQFSTFRDAGQATAGCSRRRHPRIPTFGRARARSDTPLDSCSQLGLVAPPIPSRSRSKEQVRPSPGRRRPTAGIPRCSREGCHLGPASGAPTVTARAAPRRAPSVGADSASGDWPAERLGLAASTSARKLVLPCAVASMYLVEGSGGQRR